MKKLLIFACLFCISTIIIPSANAQIQKVRPNAPVITQEMKPVVQKYRGQNYVGAIQDIEKILEEREDIYAKYYLALCYTQLGQKQNAQKAYQDVIDSQGSLPLTYYSKKALACLDNPESQECHPEIKQINNTSDMPKQELDDISAFIQSGKKIHPSAMDKIINGRLDRKMQEEEYIKKQIDKKANLKSEAPTNEEIASALNTLSKIGYNPFQNNMNNPQYNINPYMFLGNASQDYAKMMMYNQLNNQMGYHQNSLFESYGI